MEPTLGFTVGVADIVSGDGMLSGEVTNLGHDYRYWEGKDK